MTESREEECDTLIEKPEAEEEEEPLWSFMYLGFVGNLCFNYVLQEAKYFEDVFGKGFGGQCSFLYALANTCGQLALIFVGSSFSFASRIVVSCAVLSAAMVCIPILTYFHYGFELYVVYGLIVVMGLMVAVLASAGFSLTGLCSNQIRLYFTFGTCLAGLTAWPLMLLAQQVLQHLFHLSPVRITSGVPSKAEGINCLIVIGTASACFLLTIPFFLLSLGKTKAVRQAVATVMKRKLEVLTGETKQETVWPTVVAVLPMAVAVWNIMFVTFLALPDQMVQWTPGSEKLKMDNENTYQDAIIFIFNLFDVLARLVAMKIVTVDAPTVMWGSFLRWALLPLFFLSTARRMYLENDIFKICLQAVFGGTYGYFLTCGMMLGPSQPGIKKERADTAGSIMSFALVNGILVGAMLSGLLRDIPKTYLNFRPFEMTCQYSPASMIACTDAVAQEAASAMLRGSTITP